MSSAPRLEMNPNVVLLLLQDAKDQERGGDGGQLRLNRNAASALAELCRLFVVSARARAEAEAVNQGDDSVAPEHIEAVMAELLHDF